MKIKQLKIKNIGSYEGEHIFSFDIDDPQKNIVLIGGRNGAGKTTLFESIRLCLYGYKLYGYRQNNQVYTETIKAFINDKAKDNPPIIASIAMQIVWEDGYENNIYEIVRNWILTGDKLKETYIVLKGECPLKDDELQDFDNFLLQMIPPALFNLHFFNGENISAFLFDKTNGQAFRKAFMQLCGLDTFDLLEEQLRNNIHPHKGDKVSEIQSQYDNSRQRLLEMDSAYQDLIKRRKDKQEEIDMCEEQVVLLDKRMEQYGGVEEKEWSKFQETIKTEEAGRETSRNFLRGVSNDIIPFIIMEKQLISLKEQLIVEERLKKNRFYQSRVFDSEVKKALNSKLKPYILEDNNELPNSFFEVLYSVIKEECQEGQEEILFLSEIESMELLSKINKFLNYDIDKIIDAEKEIERSLSRVKQLRATMESKEIIDASSYLLQKNNLLVDLDKLRKEQYEIQINIVQLEEEFKIAEQDYAKSSGLFKEMLKEKSVTDMSARALLAFDELKQHLYMKYVKMTEELFAMNFKRLISKTDLIDGIYISSLFEVIAYKQMNIDICTILEQIKEYGAEYVKNKIGERALELIKVSGLDKGMIDVPMKVEQHFSAGEQQIFVMALYQSLTALRPIELPFIIDTPLARIDSEHRKNILRSFFAELPGQVIILSTDEEIDHESMEMLSKKISDVYLIEHQMGGSSKANKNMYFGEVRN